MPSAYSNQRQAGETHLVDSNDQAKPIKSDQNVQTQKDTTTKFFRLMDLPGEIRNLIYEFALTSPSPLHYREPISDTTKPLIYEPATEYSQAAEINQIKYVNKRLYAETAGLEVVFNTILFARKEEKESTPGTMFLRFWNSMTDNKKMRMLHAQLEDKFSEAKYDAEEDPNNRLFALLDHPTTDSAMTIACLADACDTSYRLRNKKGTLQVDYILPYWRLGIADNGVQGTTLVGMYVEKIFCADENVPAVLIDWVIEGLGLTEYIRGATWTVECVLAGLDADDFSVGGLTFHPLVKGWVTSTHLSGEMAELLKALDASNNEFPFLTVEEKGVIFGEFEMAFARWHSRGLGVHEGLGQE
ncbi:hypothetical protein P280DRAFT_507848 [Massarina eburnea CBS 473.64]|uniref:F-box domain-containing protein n=1 Tax=Massarina eburnea CBS 473.64 TaxID=1395130 RepID=A0A6A6RZV9_9PLEO|nr:hypothetical protein P280DRAFT_507848 [Massarina eburnea CBS 473.64]